MELVLSIHLCVGLLDTCLVLTVKNNRTEHAWQGKPSLTDSGRRREAQEVGVCITVGSFWSHSAMERVLGCTKQLVSQRGSWLLLPTPSYSFVSLHDTGKG